MPVNNMKLVTVICEALARDAVTAILKEYGAHGYTISPAEGAGDKGERTLEMTEYANIRIEVLLPSPAAERLMERLSRDFFPNYAMILYETDVRVMRPGKF